jgi:hypothetical protein
MHSQSLVLHLNSCIKETIYSAIGRYTVLGLIQSKTYNSTAGSHTTFISSSTQSKPLIEKVVEDFTGIYILSTEDFSLWGERISLAVEKSLVVKSYERAKL